MTYMWQEEKGKPYYRFQTDDKDIADKMKRRNKFELSAWGVNCKLWIYIVEFPRPIRAKEALKSLTKKGLKFDENKEIYCSG